MLEHGIPLDPDAIRSFCRKWKIRQLSVFGSVLSDRFGPDSDIDFLADFDTDEEWDLLDELRMRDELEQMLGRSVDLLDRAALAAGGNRLFQREVLSTAETIYAA